MDVLFAMKPDSASAAPGLAQPRELLARLFADAVRAVRGDELIRSHARLDKDRWIYEGAGRTIEWGLPAGGRIILVGAGKAVASLAKGLERQFGDRIDDGCIVTKYGHTEPLKRIRQIEAGHPIPDERGAEGTRLLMRTVADLGPDDRVFVLITGGASALMVAPAPPIRLADKALVTDLLIRSHASIEEINTVRQALSAVKAGRLLDHIWPAQSMTLLISDIPSGELSKIGSGPTIRQAPGGPLPCAILRGYDLLDKIPASVAQHLARSGQDGSMVSDARGEVILLADRATLVAAVDDLAAACGIAVRHVDVAMQGNTHAAAHAFAAAMKDYKAQGGASPCLFVSAGETTLEVRGSGRGGRNQEFALTAAGDLAGIEGCVLLAAGTDGTDGPTPAAGAFADGTTCKRAAQSGLSIERTLADNDSYSLLEAIGDLYISGPTGTNVMDLVLGLVF